jgi:hypothetical protein
VSQEHIFGDWLRKRGVVNPTGGPITQLSGDSFQGVAQFRGQAKVLNATVGAACESCNTGWMSGLENRVAPILTPMIRDGAETTLGFDQRFAIARWSEKTAIILNERHKRNAPRAVVPAEDARALFQRQAPSPRVSVALAAYTGPHYGVFHATHLVNLKPLGKGLESRHGYRCMVVIGHLILQIAGHSGPEDIAIQTRRESDHVFTKIWPASAIELPIAWPPELVVNPHGLDAVLGP